jgi:hypothetical protein
MYLPHGMCLYRFRAEFPYYYDGCMQASCCNREGNEYLGTMFPSLEERAEGCKASRTELYVCGKCAGVSRFPRYHAAKKVKA